MTLRIEVTIPEDDIKAGAAAQYLARAMTAIGFDRGRGNNYDQVVHAEDAPVSFVPNPPAEAQVEIEVQPEETSSEPAPQRERGKPAPGKARRTKAEIEEDEAADAADAAASGVSETATDKPAISTGEERISPSDTRYFWHPESSCLMKTEDGSHPGGDGLVEEIDAEQYAKIQAKLDAADEAADPANAPAAEATRDDVRTAMMGYSEKHGLPALTTRLTAIFNEKFPGQGVTKLSEIPEDAAAFQSVIDALNAEG